MIRKVLTLASMALLSLQSVASASNLEFASAKKDTQYCINQVRDVRANRNSVVSKAEKTDCQAEMTGRSLQEVAAGRKGGVDSWSDKGGRQFSGSSGSLKAFH